MIDATRCPACQRHDASGRSLCLACGNETEPASLPATGTVLAWTRYPERETIALVELEGGARVLATPEETASTLEPGLVVQLQARADRFTFEPAGDP